MTNLFAGRLRTLGITAIALCLAPPGAVSQSIQDQTRARYETAQKALGEGRYEEAERNYKAILILEPSLAEAHANLGIVYYLEFKYPRAAESLNRALRLRPDLTRSRLYLGLAQAALGEYQNSIRSIEAALTAGLETPYRKLARRHLARDYLALDQTEKALDILRPLVEEFPQDTDLLYTLGKAYLRLSAAAAQELALAGDTARVHQMLAENFVNQGKYKEAIDEYRAALARDPKLPGADYELGMLLSHQDKTEEGRLLLERMAVSEPENIRARDRLKQSRLNHDSDSNIDPALSAPSPGTKNAAARIGDRLPEVLANDRQRTDRGSLEKAQKLYEQGQYEEATRLSKQLALQVPRPVDALYWLVKSYQALSLRAFERIAQVGPDSARAHQLLAEGFEQQEKFGEAVEEYGRAFAKDPRLPGLHYAAGLDRMKLGQWDDARREFESELTLDPFNAGANFRLGQLAYRFSEYSQAARYFARAAEIYPEFGEAQAQLGQVLIKQGQHRQAIPHLLAATRLTPDDHTIHFQLFRAYRALGEQGKAQQELETFQRMENEKKEATLRKAAQSMEQFEKARKEPGEPSGTTTPSKLPP